MRNLPLFADGDLVTRLARERDSVRAVVELVRNAIDAGAETVRVTLERSGTDAIQTEAGCASAPMHMIHLNEDKFLGPHAVEGP